MQPKKGDIVKVYCNIKNNSAPRKYQVPFEFKLGYGDVLKGIEDAVQKMIPGESKELVIPPERAFGNRNEKNVLVFVKPGYYKDKYQTGDTYEYFDPMQKKRKVGIVTKVGEKTFMVDFNNPLCDQDIQCELELIGIKSSSGE